MSLKKTNIDKKELDKILENADRYLKDFGKKKNLNWFDMSHLLSYLFPETDKEKLLERHMELFDKDKE